MSMMQLLLGTPPAAPSGIVTSGLVLHLDVGDAGSYPGSGTAWTDLSGNGNNGTLTNGPTYSAADGGQIILDGTNDFVAIAGSTSLAFGAADFTIEAWFKLTSAAFSYAQIYEFRWGASASFDGYFLRFADGGFGERLQFGNYSGSLGDIYSVPFTRTSLLNTWACFVHTRSSGVNRAYVNAAGVNFYSGTSGPPFPLSSFTDTRGSATLYNHRLGQALSGVFPFPGAIAITHVYNRALPLPDIEQNFGANRARFGL
jgi:hypothetical protein